MVVGEDRIGGGTPPILTLHGWLVICHGVSSEVDRPRSPPGLRAVMTPFRRDARLAGAQRVSRGDPRSISKSPSSARAGPWACAEELPMTAIASPEHDGKQPGGVGRQPEGRASRRGDLEALAFLVGLFGTLLVAVVIIGSASPFGP